LGFGVWSSCGTPFEFRSPVFGTAEVAHESANQVRGVVGEPIRLFEVFLADIVFVQCGVEFVFYFADGPLGLREKLDELSVPLALEPARRIWFTNAKSEANAVERVKR
jgi:hypothetical protein